MKYYLIAGEASGDLYGASLMQELLRIDPDAQFRFWGGDLMAAVGGSPVRHIRDLAFMGFVEVAAHLSTVLGNIHFCHHDIAEFAPDVVVGIDYPGFNLKIEAWAKKRGFKTVHYISPNLWAWKKGRIAGMRRSLDLLCYILPFEERFFAQNNMPQALYVGHPLLDSACQPSSTIECEKPIVALLPGSRRQELQKNLPLMAGLARLHPEYHFIVAGMSLLGNDIYRQLIPPDCPVEVRFDQTRTVLASAYAAVVCSGTATLEAALYNVPQVVCYRANPVSIAIAKAVVSRRIRYISLVNLIADSPVVAELLQEDFNPERLEREFQCITADHTTRERMLKQYADMRALLGNGGANRRAAEAINALIP